VPILAHLSDLHATPVRLRHPGEILNKRLLGWLSWTLRRRHEHRAAVLEALTADLGRLAPDHVAVTGDLTNLGLEDEFQSAARWLRRLGGADRVSVVPGNHDVYVKTAHAETWAPWAPYLAPLPAAGAPATGAVRFPTIRRCAGLALVCASSARATLPLLATGRLGRGQRERLEQVLGELGEEGAYRVLLLHHPPVPGESARRRLTDAAALRDILARVGAELVLHGHSPGSHFAALAGPKGPIPVVGAPSASALGRRRPSERAGYHVYRVAPDRSVVCEVRRLRGDGRGFERALERALA
jgi:3',5'-cyclic AMP phosphodiesterase CpdA